MANRWPIASGNWSNSAIWSGSLIPTAADDVYANNRLVTVDQDITVRSINNFGTSSAVAGGQLNIYSDYNITATPNGLNSSDPSNSILIRYHNSGSISIIGTFLQTRYILENVNNGTINVIGEVRFPSTATPARTIINSLNGTINIIGNITCPSSTANNNIAVLNSSNGTINVTGNIIGGNTGTSAIGIFNNSVGNINITGNVTGGTSTTCNGINNSSIGIVNITGIVTGGTSTAIGINSTTAGIINVIGQLQASTTANAVSSTSTTATNVVSGPFINSGSRNAIYCYNVRLYDDNTTRYTIGVSGSTDTISLLSPDQVTGVPSGSNVRAGISFGPGNELTGSMQVPNPQSVSVGVAVDNTVGTAIAKPEDLWNYAVTALTASNSIGQRLASTATSASNAAIVTAFG